MNKIISVVLAIATFFLLNSYSVNTYPELAELVLHEYENESNSYIGAAREQLDEQQRQLYDVIKTALINSESEIIIKRFSYSDDDLHNAIWCVMHDSPDLFWVDYWTNWAVVRESDAGTITLTPKYIFAASEIPAKQTEFNEAMYNLVELASEKSSERSKAEFVHDYLIDKVTYSEDGTATIHSAYGALVDGRAVCDGYAHAYQLILQKLGIETFYVEGRTRGEDGVGHAWNIVKTNDIYSHVDVTWDDYVESLPNYTPEIDEWENNERMPSHSMFLISDEEIDVTHAINSPIEFPECDNYGYFSKRKIETDGEFSEISDSVAEALLENIANGKCYIEFRVLDSEEYEKLTNVATRWEYAYKDIQTKVNTELHKNNENKGITMVYIPSISAMPNNTIMLVVRVEEV